jgi:hypothetical protein
MLVFRANVPVLGEPVARLPPRLIFQAARNIDAFKARKAIESARSRSSICAKVHRLGMANVAAVADDLAVFRLQSTPWRSP